MRLVVPSINGNCMAGPLRCSALSPGAVLSLNCAVLSARHCAHSPAVLCGSAPSVALGHSAVLRGLCGFLRISALKALSRWSEQGSYARRLLECALEVSRGELGQLEAAHELCTKPWLSVCAKKTRTDKPTSKRQTACARRGGVGCQAFQHDSGPSEYSREPVRRAHRRCRPSRAA
jgi:hypothetical protein